MKTYPLHIRQLNYLPYRSTYLSQTTFIRNLSLSSLLHATVPTSNIVPFKLADIGEGIKEVEIKEWYVKVGDHVKQFDKVCEVQSDKANVTITCRYDGQVMKLYHQLGETANVGEPLVDIKLTQDSTQQIQDTSGSNLQDDAGEERSSSTKLTPTPQVLATPAVRRLAKDLQISLNDIQGTGKDGRISKEDILNFDKTKVVAPSTGAHTTIPTSPVQISMPSIPPSPATVKQPITKSTTPISTTATNTVETPRKQVQPMKEDRHETIKGIKKIMVKTMTQANSIPHFTYCDDYDLTELVKLRKKLKKLYEQEKKTLKLSYMPFIIKACSLALTEYPILNAHVDAKCETIIYKATHNIGVAMDTRDGLLVPNVKNVQTLSIQDIASELTRLQQQAYNGKLTNDDMQGGTFSLSNIGAIGGTYAVPVLVVPEVAIGALGKISLKACAPENLDDSSSSSDDDEYYPNVRFRHMMSISWSADHRVIDGATMARFSNKLKSYLENPISMMINTK
ncbi:unnamed protein product [Didymodactylos carnosus]|uniref:Dihydrolipoamide acetyltransferase component of pyruvate dehydrogenase complex n=1 Tax=Didymodactylos carnosus TaxID=1234261 RepID=A0A813RUR0_9BILA|nr:unnamed protein product [Didymodactylos carnosus]CAF0787093.1 unnamed protein product [Didymodactylos carnosus]CAF3495664.1 unnamed protein product [Didymodactylos carnosus]CAF3571048.1 unnamed protein product [Didymodactylos carnosus]